MINNNIKMEIFLFNQNYENGKQNTWKYGGKKSNTWKNHKKKLIKKTTKDFVFIFQFVIVFFVSFVSLHKFITIYLFSCFIFFFQLKIRYLNKSNHEIWYCVFFSYFFFSSFVILMWVVVCEWLSVFGCLTKLHRLSLEQNQKGQAQMCRFEIGRFENLGRFSFWKSFLFIESLLRIC